MAGALKIGCASIPTELEGDVARALKATDQGFASEMKALDSKMRIGGAKPEDILNMQKKIRTLRRATKLELHTVSGVDSTARALLEKLDGPAWAHIFEYGNARAGFYARFPDRAVESLKGILAERIFDATPEFGDVLRRAQARGQRFGIAAEDIKYIEGTRGITLSDKSLTFVNHGELTDGLITGTRRTELTSTQRAAREAERGQQFKWAASKRGIESPIDEELRLLTMKESKSPSNMEKLAMDHGGEWLGQVDKNIERFTQVPCCVNGKWYTPRQVRVSLYHTETVVVVPKGMNLSSEALERLNVKLAKPGSTTTQTVGRLFREYQMPVADYVMNAFAKRIYDRR